MTTYIASTTTEVQAMVAAAQGGDTVLLSPGTYDNISLSGTSKASSVNIESLDPLNPALLTGLSVVNSSGLSLSDLEIQTSQSRALNVIGSRFIDFDNMDVHGTLNGTSQDDKTNGLLVRNSSYVNVTNSQFHELLIGITNLSSQNIVESGNAFDLIGNDGIDNGGTSQVVISNNTFTNFDHVGSVHPDVIQFWTANTTAPATDITITGNVFDRGTGSAVQGIFMNDELGTLPYDNVVISNNTIVGAAYQGIALINGINATVTSNVVIGADDQTSWLGLFGVKSVNMADNIASTYNISGSTVLGHGDVQASALAINPDGSFPTWQTGTLLPSSTASDQAQTDLFSHINLMGFIDGASLTGQTYGFGATSITGSSGVDHLRAGTIGSYHLYGYGGNDSLVGSKSGIASTLEGGTGDDNYTIYQAVDAIVENAGEGADTVYSFVSYTLGANVESIRAMASGLTLSGNALNNMMNATTGGDSLFGWGGDDYLIGSTSADRLYGGDGNDRLVGGVGNDFLDGGNGNDLLYGGDGNDTMTGGAGNDYFEGGPGADTMTGGSGADTYSYRTGDMAGGVAASTDNITDFRVSDGDKINLTMFDANSLAAGSTRFTYIGNQAFHGVAGELRWAVAGNGITVYGDTNGDKVADLAIHLTGLTTITSSSFVL